MLRYSLQILDKFEAQEEDNNKEEREKEAVSTTIQLAATAAKQPSNLSLKVLFVFESSF
jgi:hypothetical protein